MSQWFFFLRPVRLGKHSPYRAEPILPRNRRRATRRRSLRQDLNAQDFEHEQEQEDEHEQKDNPLGNSLAFS